MAALLVVITFLTYGHALHGPFVFDDIPNISGNPHVRIHAVSFREIWDALFRSPMETRPVANLTFALNYFFHGAEAASFRLVNFLIHIVNGLLLYAFLNITLALPANREQSLASAWLAFWATMVWFVHPLHVQSVTYVVQRMNSLATLFYLLAFLCYLRARLADRENTAWLFAGAGILSFFLALGSKEIAITLPFFILLYEWYFFRDLDVSWLRRNLVRFLGIALLVGILALSMVGLDPVEAIIDSYRNRDFTMAQRVMTEARVILHYIDLFLFPLPSRLSLLHEFDISTTLFTPPTTLPALLLLNGLVFGSLYFARKIRLLSFCLLWFFGNLFLESSLIGLEIIYEHRTYLPTMLLGILILVLQRSFIPQWVHRGIVIGLVLLFSFWTWERNRIWADEVALWADSLQKHPADVRAYNALGQALERKGEIEMALEHYRAAVRVNPDAAQSYNNLGILSSNQGDLESAVEYFDLALTREPDNPVTHYNLAVAYAELGYMDDALHHYGKAHAASSNAPRIDEDVHNNLGILLSGVGRIDEAIGHFQEAIALNPANVEAINNLAVVYTRKKGYASAAQYFRTALALRGNDPDLHTRLGLTLLFLGRKDEAGGHFQEALRLQPGHQLALRNLQMLQRMSGTTIP